MVDEKFRIGKVKPLKTERERERERERGVGKELVGSNKVSEFNGVFDPHHLGRSLWLKLRQFPNLNLPHFKGYHLETVY